LRQGCRLWTGFLFLLVAPRFAAAVELELDFGSGPATQLPKATVSCTLSSSAEASSATSVVAPTASKMRATLNLPGAGIWLCKVEAEKFWSRSQLVVASEQRLLRFELVPEVELEATIEPSLLTNESGQTPSLLFREAPALGQTSAIRNPENRAECGFEAPQLRCRVPARSLDLELRWPGHIPIYLWEQSNPVGANMNLGKLRPAPGASISGHILTADALKLPKETRVRVEPFSIDRPQSPTGREQAAAQARSVSVTDRGFFQIGPLPAGAYSLVVTAPGYAVRELGPLSVEPSAESRLRQPLRLERPVEVTGEVQPFRQPSGALWRLRLEQDRPGLAKRVEVASGAAKEDGRFTIPGLTPGDYWLTLLDEITTPLLSQLVQARQGAAPILLQLERISVEGRVLLGEEPLAANLVFGGRRGTDRLRFSSDEEGLFSGALPREGRWPVFVEAQAKSVTAATEVQVEAPSSGGPAQILVQIPNTSISGLIVDPQGQPVPGAAIEALAEPARDLAQARSDAEGQFRLRGLEPGLVRLSAQAKVGSRRLRLDGLLIDLADSAHQDQLRLVLQEGVALRGRVIGRNGPIAGARIDVTPLGPTPSLGTPVSSSPSDGSFEVELPAGSTGATAVVQAPGHVLTFRTLRGSLETDWLIVPEEVGGDLEVLRGASLPEAPAESLLVWFEGEPVHESLLRAWASVHAELSANPDRLQVPQMPAGSYSACRVSRREVAARFLANGNQAPGPWGRCASGFLSPGSRLVLDLSPEP
jgi:hypothetical protein